MFFIALLLIVFALLMALAVPIGYVIGITASFGLLYIGGTDFLRILVTRYNSGLTGFVLVAVPMFTLAAQFMNRSGVTVLLINFAKVFLDVFAGDWLLSLLLFVLFLEY